MILGYWEDLKELRRAQRKDRQKKRALKRTL